MHSYLGKWPYPFYSIFESLCNSSLTRSLACQVCLRSIQCWFEIVSSHNHRIIPPPKLTFEELGSGQVPYPPQASDKEYHENWRSVNKCKTSEGSFPSKSACIIGLNVLKKSTFNLRRSFEHWSTIVSSFLTYTQILKIQTSILRVKN